MSSRPLQTSSRRLRRGIALAATAALAFGFAPASLDADGVHTTEDVCIASVPETDPLAAGDVEICVTVFKPASASKDAKAPVVLHSHGWGGSRTSAITDHFRAYLDEGVGIVSIDQRGHGQSGGKAHVEDPAFEGEDVINVIDHVASLDWVKQNGKDDPVLGAIGGSYGGGYQFVGAFTELMKTGETRFDALAPQITWFSLNESLAPQEVVRTTWVAALYAAGADQHTSTVHAGFVEGSATGNWPETMDEFFLDNGPAWHASQGRQLDVPVLLGQGTSDNLFPLDQALKNFDQALTDKAKRRSMVVAYNGGHALPNVLPAGSAGGSDACSPLLGGEARPGMSAFDTLALDFLVERLKGERRDVTGHGQYHLTTADGSACLTVDAVTPTESFEAGTFATTTTAGGPQHIELAQGPLTIAGTPELDATVTALGLDSRAFFALSVGSSPADARVVQNNVLPHRERSLNLGSQRTIELPSIAVEVPEGQSLYLTVSPVSDMFAGHASRTPGSMLLQDAVVRVPVVR